MLPECINSNFDPQASLKLCLGFDEPLPNGPLYHLLVDNLIIQTLGNIDIYMYCTFCRYGCKFASIKLQPYEHLLSGMLNYAVPFIFFV